MSTEHNKAVVRRWLLEGFNNCDLTAVEECLTEDYINHGTTEARGYEAGRQVLTQAKAFAPDTKIVINSMVAEGDTVQEGQALCTVEAMKMENILRAERSGVVSKLNAAPGDSLAVDDVIMEFE